MKTVQLHEETPYTTNGIAIKSNSNYLELKIDKDWLMKLVRVITIAIFAIGYVYLTYLSFQMNEVYFWSLIKVGGIVGLISTLSFIKN